MMEDPVHAPDVRGLAGMLLTRAVLVNRTAGMPVNFRRLMGVALTMNRTS